MERLTKDFDMHYMKQIEMDRPVCFQSLLNHPITRLRKCVSELKFALGSSEIGEELESCVDLFILSAEEHWISRSRQSFTKYNEAAEKV